MRQQLFDFDLKRVSREHYITGKAAINIPRPETTTGGWHFLSYFDRESGVAKMSLAGIHYPDTMGFFGDEGIIDVTDRLAEFGWSLDGHRLFMADHYRATPDMIVKWALFVSFCPSKMARLIQSPCLFLLTTNMMHQGRLLRWSESRPLWYFASRLQGS
ncbi:hypothetical protein [Pseudomonas sp. CHM02]|uniref:hypothetical protein n=1 Tax=Pseudomonas sp. CHM02 TaxID=1463662 RepID=UPI0004724120|nr:hypothetical protein [Pseudomonas sp. CHM02]